MPNILSISAPHPPKPLITEGDMIVMGPADAQRLIGAADGLVLKSKGAAKKPAYENPFSVFTTKGDMLVQGVSAAQRIPASTLGFVLQSLGAEQLPAWLRYNIRRGGLHHASWTASANETKEIDGVGFEPSLLIVICADSTDTLRNWSIGYVLNNDDSITQICMRSLMDGARKNLTASAGNIYRDSSNKLVSNCTDFNSTGYDIATVVTGTCSVDFMILAIS